MKITSKLVAATLLLVLLPTTILRAAPVADANGPYTANEGTEVIFDASLSTDPDGNSLQYRWDFDNDGTWDTDWSDSPQASHTWYDDWTGTAKVEVGYGELTDTATATAEVTINNVAPVVEAGLDQTAGEGSLVSFSGSFTDPGADTHTVQWSFGDGNGDTGTLDPTHVYGGDGVYTVTLTVTDDNGGLGTDTLTVTVSDLAPTAEFTWTPEPQDEGSEVIFTDASTSYPDVISGWYWEFGDGETSTMENPTHAYGDNGMYTVTLTVTDEDGSTHTISHDVNILNVAPTAKIESVTAPDPIFPGDTISFSGGAVDPGILDTLTFEWDFGDGSTASGSSVNHVLPIIDHAYANPGIYTVTLTVTDDDGGSDSDTCVVAVISPAIVDINPNTLNLKSRGRWITCYIELPGIYGVADIDVSTILLNGVVPAELKPIAIGDHDGDGVLDLMIKFNRAAVIRYIMYTLGITNGEVTLTVTGEVADLAFSGSDTIRVIGKNLPNPATLTIVVTDKKTKLPIQGASIYLDGELKGTTDENGKLTIENVAAGKHVIEIAKEGYVTYQGQYSITKTTTKMVKLKPLGGSPKR